MFSSGKTRSQGNTPVGDRSLGSKPMVVVMDRSTGRLNLAFQELKKMPRKFVNKYGEEITELDLTSNEIRYLYICCTSEISTYFSVLVSTNKGKC